jgi:hypothetical protein
MQNFEHAESVKESNDANNAQNDLFEENPVSQKRKIVTDKIKAIANSKCITIAKTRICDEIGNMKRWYGENWASGGYGKFRVVVACVIILLAVRGLLCGWSSSGTEVPQSTETNAENSAKIERTQAQPEPSRPYVPETHIYACQYCGNQIRSSSWPTGFKCPQRPQRPAGRVRLPNLPCQWQRMDY